MELEYRNFLIPSDFNEIEKILHSSGYFHPGEIDIALELVDENLKKGNDSGYYFITALNEGRVTGYSCYGPIPCTINRWDIYWLAVSDTLRGRGIGGILLAQSEEHIRRMGGVRSYIETSSRPLYASTRSFHEKQGYVLEAVLKDYYDDGDDKCLYVKVL